MGAADHASSTVLLVDDEPQVTQGLSAVLRPLHLEVLVADSGTGALHILRQRKVDLLVSDERMPDMRGSELLSVVSREFPDTGRVILTGHATVESTVQAINRGKVFRVLEKPCRPEEFRATVEEALRAVAQARMTARLIEIARMEGIDRRLDDGASAAGAGPRPGERTRAGSSGAFDAELLAQLSTRERDVFDLIVDGLRVSQVAKALFISEQTVRNHLKSIFSKLDVHSQMEILSKGRSRSLRG